MYPQDVDTVTRFSASSALRGGIELIGRSIPDAGNVWIGSR